jgi:hypothetical protein
MNGPISETASFTIITSNTITAGSVLAAPGGVLSIPITLTLTSGASVDALTFGVQVTPNGNAPALTGSLTFTKDASIVDTPLTASATASSISVLWASLTSPLSGARVLGVLSGTVPGNAANGQSYTVAVTSVSGSRSGKTVTVSTGPNGAINLTLQSQTISFGPLSNEPYGSPPFTVSATASSGLLVGFASTTLAVCTVSGTTVTLIDLGTCTIQATQTGSANYAAATPVTRSFQSTPSLCAVSQGGKTTVVDVQSILNEALGVIPPGNDLNGDGVVNIADTEIVINAALGLGCTPSSGMNLVASRK